jgi:hypothetical protein
MQVVEVGDLRSALQQAARASAATDDHHR